MVGTQHGFEGSSCPSLHTLAWLARLSGPPLPGPPTPPPSTPPHSTTTPHAPCARSNAARLYSDTAKLLVHAARSVEGVKGSELGKEALRILAERLCAVCCMREAAQQPRRFDTFALQVGRGGEGGGG